jgi:imidazolonepropionase-like amidohydrolase
VLARGDDVCLDGEIVMRKFSNSYPTLAANWDHFSKVDIAPDAPQIQREEMKRAFYAGASSGMLLVVVACDGKSDEEFAIEVLKLNAELCLFSALRKAMA